MCDPKGKVISLRAIGMFLAMAGIPFCAQGTPVIGTPATSAVTSTGGYQVTATSQITVASGDPALIPGGVNLLRVDGAVPTILGIMHDDGFNGDAVAGDGIYTLVFTASAASVGQMQIQVSAAFRGPVRRLKSTAAAIQIAGPTIVSVNPNTGEQGQQGETVNLTGQNTNWVQGTSTAFFSSGGATYHVTVPGTADLWLAGQPGDASLIGDTVAADGAVLAWSGLNPQAGSYLTFSATGSTNFSGTCPSTSPDAGECGNLGAAAFSISQFTGPANALIGVFINPNTPVDTPPDPVDDSDPATQSQAVISPLLNQVFFIGDGLTGTGTGAVQRFVIPAGATQLYLGSMDLTGQNFDNSGSYNVVVTDLFAGLTVSSLTVNSATSATAVVNIDAAAPLGTGSVTVTTGAEVAALNNGFTVTAGTPMVTQVSPNTGYPGQQNVSVAVTGQYTHWVQGATTASFGAGITVATLTVNSATSATAVLNIDLAAPAGPHAVTFTTGVEVAALNSGFLLKALTLVSPNTGQQGQQNEIVNLTGQYTNWVQGDTIAFFGLGVTSTVTVPGTADIWVAGLPAGSGVGADIAPDESPVLAWSGMNRLPGTYLTFAATGAANYGACYSTPPDGDASACGGFSGDAANGISSFYGPANALIGVFVNDDTLTGTPPEGLDYTDPALQSQPVIAPLLNQVFFIGDGLTGAGTGSIQKFVVPEGAMRLYLGSVDCEGCNYNNTGSFNVVVSDPGAGISVSSLTVNSPTSATAVVDISPLESTGANTVTVTTGAEVVALNNGFTVTAGTPVLTQLSPNVGQQAQQSESVSLTGQHTHWVQGATTASFGAGITVASLTVSSITSATAILDIDAAAAVASRTVTVTTGAEVVTLNNAFSVTGRPVLTLVSPNAGQQSQHSETVNLTGQYTHWLQGTTTVVFGDSVSPTNIVVPGTADLWLAGQPDATVLGADTAPANSPVLAWSGQNPTPGRYLTISATGQTDSGGCQGNSPDGDGCDVLSTAPALGISGFAGPTNALIGVFVNASSINSPTPPDALDFSTPDLQGQATISPQLNQVFFIGDGLTGIGTGSAQQFVIPAGATQLYLGSSDMAGANFNNTSCPAGAPIPQGCFFVVVSDSQTGITLTNLTVQSPTSATAMVNIDPSATLGTRSVAVATGSEVVALNNGFTVTPGPALLSISPASALVGQADVPVTITGQYTHFTNASVIDLGPGIAASAISSTDATHLSAQLTIAGGGNLVQNGSLEDLSGFFVNTSLNYMSLPAGVATITGWTVTPSTSGLIAWAKSPTGDSHYAADGAYFVNLTGFGSASSPNGAIAQQLQNLVSGRQYTFSMDTLVDTSQPTVTIGSVTVALSPGQAFQAGNDSWVPQTGAFVADSASPVLTIANPDPQQNCSIDNIAIVEPGWAAGGAHNLTVSTGTEVESLTNGFTVNGAPVVLSVTPASGAQTLTNVPVTITGQYTHFSNTSVVTFSGTGVTAGAPITATATSLTVPVTIAAGAAVGSRQVQVQTGSETVSMAGAYTVVAPMPALSQASPNTGQQGQQNESVSLTGQFTHWVQGTTTASFGAGIAVANLTINSATTATAVLNIDPAAALGPSDVLVTTGAEAVTLMGGFTVTAGTAAVTLVNPNSGAQGQQNEIVNVTAQFTHWVDGASTVSFGAGVTVVGLNINSATSATVALNIDPAAVPGTRNVKFAVGSEVATLNGGFTVTVPTPALTLLNPNSGTQGQQNLSVAITGQVTHFVQGTTTVSFGAAGITVNSVTVSSATSLTASISLALGATTGNRNVTATTGSEVAALAAGFFVQPAVNQSPVITIAPTWSLTLPGELTLTYTVTDDGLPVGGGLTVSWGVVSGPGNVGFQNQTLTSASATFDQAGTYVLQIGASDTQLITTQTVTVTVTGTPVTPPTVSISSPADGASVTTLTDVMGSVAGSALASWTLEFHMQNESTFRPIASGTAAVTNSLLGTFDPTLLVNGLAQIQLRATDTYGQTNIYPISVVVTGSQKAGMFTLSFNDLNVPVAGLPIQVVRTYDSRNKAAGDFGVGWRLDLTTVTVAANGPLGDNWAGTRSGGFLPSYCVLATDSHVVTVTFADGTVYQFQPALAPACQVLTPVSQTSFGFTPIGTTPANASLAIVGNNQPIVDGDFPGTLTLDDPDTGLLFDANLYSLTMPNGSVLVIGAQSGLQSMTDANGNTLTVTPDGITHSSGKSVSFQRGQGGQILQVTDPNGHSIVYGYDDSNDLASVTDAAGNVTTFTYDGNHGLLTIVDPSGVQPIKNIYDDNGRLTQHIDAFGNVVNFNNDLSAQQEIVTDRLGNVTANYYDASGNIVQITDALGGNKIRTYDANNNLLTETNALNETLTYTYDASNNRLTSSDALGNQTAYTYNGLNQILTITDPLGHITTNTYDASGNLLSAQDPAGGATTYAYGSNGLQLTMQDALGGTTSYQYDGAGDLTQQTDALGHIATYTFDANGNKLTETKTRTTASGSESLLTQYQYDALNRITQTTFPDGSTTKTQYNSIGKQSMTTDQLGRQTSYTYDMMARLTQTTYPDSTSEISAYDADGHRISSTDRGGRTTAYQYDALGRLTKTTYPDGTSTTTAYDATGLVQSVTDALGNKTQYAYDAAGHRTKVTDALGNATSYTYDAAGNQTSMTDANGHMTQYRYDNNRRRTTVTYPDGTTDTTSYDFLGRTTGKTDQAGESTQFSYDALGQLTQVTDAKGQLTTYTYDEVGNRIAQTDANGHTTAFAYDKLGRLIKRTLPAGMSETTNYDSAGNVSSLVDFNGKTTTYTYDTVNRVTKKSPDAAFAAPSITFTYTSTGQRQSMTDASGGTTYTYDSQDRLLTKATPQGTLAYTYDSVGKLRSIRSSNTGGTSVDYTYDADKRLSIVKDNRLTAGTTTYTYDGSGNLSGFAYPNGVKTAYTYDILNRLTNLTSTAGTATLANYGYTLGPAGNRTAVSESGGRQVSYTYDALYRLTGETIAGGTVNGAIGYQYDPAGNRMSRTSTVAPVPPATSSYDANDRLTTDTYDANGNTTASASNSYAYDFENHLAAQNGNGAVIVYDGDGNRVAETVGGITTRYLLDDRNLTGYVQVLDEVAGGTAQRVYTYGLNRISQSQASGTSYYGYDGRGSVRFLTDTTGAITDRYDYDAFGNLINKVGTTPNVYLFSGEQLDSNLGLYYMRARYTSSVSGRFWTTDPWTGSLTDPSSLHKYVYGRNDPVNRTDPSGRQYAEVALDVAVIVSFGSLPSSDSTVFHSIYAVNDIAHCCIDPATKLQNVALQLISNGGPDWAYDLYNMATQTQAQGYQMIAETLGITYKHVLDEVLGEVTARRIDSEILAEAGVSGLPGYKDDLTAFLAKLNGFTQAWSSLLTGASTVSECDDTSFLAVFNGAYFDGVVQPLLLAGH